MKFSSIKLLIHDRRIRALPLSLEGTPFVGPGIDLLGEEAGALLATFRNTISPWFEEREPGCILRSIVYRFETRAIVATLETGERPNVIRLDATSSQALWDILVPLLPAIEAGVLRAVRARATI